MGRSKQDYVKLKTPYVPTEFKTDELQEFIKCAKDPIYFMENYVYIQHPTKGKIKFAAYDFQKDLVNTYNDFRNVIAMIPRQSGKALDIRTPIATPTGWTTMGDIKVGDKILGANGLETTVTFATDIMYDHKCYEISFDNGESIIADAEHLWNITSGFWTKKNQTITTEDIFNYKKKHNTSLYIDIVKPIPKEHKNLVIPPYILGLWLGDGSSDGGCYTQSVTDNIEMIQNIEETGFSVSAPRANSPNSEIRTIYKLRPLLRNLNLLKNKHIPNDYFQASIAQRIELLQGLMDTDGYVDKGGHCVFYQKNYELIKQVRELISSLGIKSRCKFKTLNGERYYEIIFSTVEYSVFKLKRKLDRQYKCKNHPKNKRIYISNIIETKSVPVRCIQVDNADHLFTCGETMIPTHNTTTAASFLLWYATFNSDVTILIAANKFKAASEIMSKVKYAYEELPNFLRAGAVNYNVTEIEFDNGSRIKAATTTPDSGRGLAISLLYLDEFAFVKPRIAEEFWSAMAPTLATGGKCIITSTPMSDEDKFAELWYGATKTIDEAGLDIEDGIGINGFKSFSAHYSDVPGRDEVWAQKERAKIGEEKFQREYECAFAGEESTLISGITLHRLTGKNPLYQINGTRYYENIYPDKTYLVSLDPSPGVGQDPACIQIWSLPDLVQVGEWTHNKVNIPGQMKLMQTIINGIYNEIKKTGFKGEPEIYYTLENNSWGEAALVSINEIGEENFMGQFLHEPRRAGLMRRKGLNTNKRTKAAACSKLKSLVESNKLQINSKQLIRQLKFFISKNDSFAAKQGEHDDCVMSTLLCIRMMQMVTNWDDKMSDIMKDTFIDEMDQRDPMPFSVLIN